MRKIQAELSFTDSQYIEVNALPSVVRDSIEKAGQDVDQTYHCPLPESKRHSTRVVCLECSRTFATRSFIPSCPGCGGSDVELA